MKFDLRVRATRFIAASRAKVSTQINSIQPLRRLSQMAQQDWWVFNQALIFVCLALVAALLVSGMQAGGKSPKSAARPAPVRSSIASPATSPATPQGWSRLPRLANTPAPKAAVTKTGQPAAKRQVKPEARTQSGQPAAQLAAQSTAARLAAVTALQALNAFTPKQEAAPVDPSNYGDRYSRDVAGRPVANQPLVVLHETVGSADSAINTFQVAHGDEGMQVSYHSIIRRDGTIVYLVPPEKRAFGAGDSVFRAAQGSEAVKTDRRFPPSVNNFAYHISLETPPGGANEYETHSGYSDAQYWSLAWLVAHTSVPDDRITTHRAVDQSGSRIDPRSFDSQKFLSMLHSLPRPALIPSG